MKEPHRSLCGFDDGNTRVDVPSGGDVREADADHEASNDECLPPHAHDGQQCEHQSEALDIHLYLARPDRGNSRMNAANHQVDVETDKRNFRYDRECEDDPSPRLQDETARTDCEECRDDQQLISDGVQLFTEARNRIRDSGEPAVDKVGAADDEQDEQCCTPPGQYDR